MKIDTEELGIANVDIEFCKMYEPGELQAPLIKEEHYIHSRPMASVPRYKDQIIFNGQCYFVHDVIYDMDEYRYSEKNKYRILIKAYRKVKSITALKRNR